MAQEYKYNEGDKVRIKMTASPTGKYARHRGKIGRVIKTDSWGGITTLKMSDGHEYNYVGFQVVAHLHEDKDMKNDEDGISRDSLEEAKAKLEKALKRVNMKLEFLDETESNIFSDKLFRAHQIIKLASDANEDKNARAELIAELL